MNPLSLLTWTRTKPADEPYSWTSGDNCAVAQFLRDTGHTGVSVTTVRYYTDQERGLLPVGVHEAVHTGEQTFGALADRLEAFAPWTVADAYVEEVFA